MEPDARMVKSFSLNILVWLFGEEGPMNAGSAGY
jgi:hypothetical protein